MSSKIIMKRKRVEQQTASRDPVVMHNVRSEAASSNQAFNSVSESDLLNSNANSSCKRICLTNSSEHGNSEEEAIEEANNQMPKSLASAQPQQIDPLASRRNELLMEALRRIVELQQELDDFEHDLDEDDRYNNTINQSLDNDNDYPYVGDHHDDNDELDDDNTDDPIDFAILHDQTNESAEDEVEHLQRIAYERRHEAEALGFAMCARETLQYLEREGIARDSLLYRSLRARLVGQTDGIIPI